MRRVTIAMIMLLALITSGCGGKWLLYYDSKTPGNVVDADTEMALEGAMVVGLWQYTHVLGSGHGGYANIEVVESSKDGSFNIPAWIWFNPLKFFYYIERSDPIIVIYKPGYGVHRSSKVWRAVSNMPTDLTEAEKIQSLIAGSINPAQLHKLTSDKQKIENIKKFEMEIFLSKWPIISTQRVKLKKYIVEEINSLTISDDEKEKLLLKYKYTLIKGR